MTKKNNRLSDKEIALRIFDISAEIFFKLIEKHPDENHILSEVIDGVEKCYHNALNSVSSKKDSQDKEKIVVS